MMAWVPRENRLAFWLAVTAVAWCVVAAALLRQVPLMRGGLHPSFAQALMLFWIPGLTSVAAVCATAFRQPVLLCLSTVIVCLFALVFGFSVGRVFVPAAGLLVWATVALFSTGGAPAAIPPARRT